MKPGQALPTPTKGASYGTRTSQEKFAAYAGCAFCYWRSDDNTRGTWIRHVKSFHLVIKPRGLEMLLADRLAEVLREFN